MFSALIKVSSKCVILLSSEDTSGSSEQINRPSRTGPLFSCFQALRARLLSFGPSGTGYFRLVPLERILSFGPSGKGYFRLVYEAATSGNGEGRLTRIGR